MTQAAILYPVFIQVALTFGLLFWTGRSRIAALKAGEVKLGDVALGQKAWPDQVTAVSNSFNNQFELPLLFYVLAGLALVTGKVSGLLVGLAWVFVAARIAHVYVYTTTNHVQHRFTVYAAGAAALLAMWAVFAVPFLLGGA